MHRFPEPVPGGSRRFPGGSQAIGNRSGERFPGLSIDREPGTAGSAVPLSAWLTSLKQRGLTLTATPYGPRIDGPLNLITPADQHTAARHSHALNLAATGTAPHWWAYASGRTDLAPDHDAMPTVPDPDDHRGHGWPCATCGQPSAYLDHQLLPFCDRHWIPDTEAAA